jgi:ribosomal protein S5
VVRATFTGLKDLQDPLMIARLRGKDLDQLVSAHA